MKCFVLLVFGIFYACSASALERFIQRDGATLKDGDKVFRFAGIQAPELHRIEDDARGVCIGDKRGWGQYFKWPTADEQENWFQSLAQTGHKAMRVYVLSVAQADDAVCGRETHILPPSAKDDAPRLNEAAMLHYDRMIALADKYNVRLILPFIDHWPWWGGRQQLAAFYGENEDDFYNVKSKTFAAYKSIIQQVILRKNTITGRLYRDEKSIMAWESGNELLGTTLTFLQQTAAHIKHLDKNHLFMDGTYTKVNEFALQDANVDIISNHYYQNVGNLSPDTVATDLKAIAGKKVYVVGEFGLLNIQHLQVIMDAAINTEYQGSKTAGAFIWGLRGHRHDGGFYWHLEPANNKTYSYHIPGFVEGDTNEEIKVVNMVRLAIAKMNGEAQMAPLPKPYAPILRKILAPQKINWLGAAVGRSYRVERAETPTGPWKIIGDNISDGKNKFDPAVDSLFADKSSLEQGKTYFYRVIAKNESGESAPSNVEVYFYQ